MAQLIHPTAPTRSDLLDSLRALALIGVVVMNVGAMVMRFAGREVMAGADALDLGMMGLDLLLFQGKARACFAFLFGVGFGILMLRAEGNASFRGFYVRRMLVLFGFGLLNQAFLFWGDILATYALLGLLLLLVRDWPLRWLVHAGIALILLPPLVIGAAEWLSGAPLPGLLAVGPDEVARGRAALMGGDYAAAVAFNLPQTALRYATDTAHMAIYAGAVLGLFLLGFAAARAGLPGDPLRHRMLLRRLAWFGIPIGLLLSALFASRLAGVAPASWQWAVTMASVGPPLLAFGYMAALTMLFARGAGRAQALLAPAGRMALTNYLLSGAIGGWIVYGYGLGQIGAFDMTGINLLALGLCAGLLLFSHFWLARFRLGPAEWLWRSGSHGTWQPLRRRSRAAPVQPLPSALP